MRILNFGSLNLDYVYQVPHFLAPGETMAASRVDVVPGGKGLNQSVALAKAGACVYHAGAIGEGGTMLTELLKNNGVDISLIRRGNSIQGNAIIQVTPSGENAILLCGGSNREITVSQVKETMALFEAGDWLILQNEVSCLKEMVQEAGKRGMRIALNPSPFESHLLELDFSLIDWLFINEVEGEQMTGETEPEQILAALRQRYPKLCIVLTLGRNGSVCDTPKERIYQEIFPVHAVDTTAAGDTFSGYMIASFVQGLPLKQCMERASAASAICVTRPGASVAIPSIDEVEQLLANMCRL